MSPTSLIFFGFVAISLIVYYIVPKKAQWIILLIASLGFFVYASKWVTLYMIGTTAIIYGGALWIQKFNDEFKDKKKGLSKEDRKVLKASIKKKQHGILTAIVVICIAILGVLKYYNFFGDIINSITELVANKGVIPTIKLALPLGISYYTLMSVSYIVDVYRGTVKAEKNPCRLLLFVCYFPHITEGPFDTYDKLSVQFKEEHKFNYENLCEGIFFLLIGLAKKMIVADRCGIYANEVFDNYQLYSGLTIILAVLLYTFELYMDFSGCIDIVRGVSKMFGIDIADNFNRPFFSKSVQEFWRRWHITLGAWLKNYVFYPVSLSNATKKLTKSCNKTIKNKYFAATIPTLLPLFCVWMIMGIWHGASWKYVVYGLYYFAIIFFGMMFEPLFIKLFEKSKIKRDGKAFGVFQILRTISIVSFGMMIFRANSITEIKNMIMLSVKDIGLGNLTTPMIATDMSKYSFLIIVISFVIVFSFELLNEKGHNLRQWFLNKNLNLQLFVFFILSISLIIFGIYGHGYNASSFIYGQF